MSTVVVELFGGPRDGERRAVPLDRFGEPPRVLQHRVSAGAGQPAAGELTYRREDVSGGGWRYRMQEAA